MKIRAWKLRNVVTHAQKWGVHSERFSLPLSPMSRIIRLNGREAAVLKAIGFGLGLTGTELQERLQMAPEDLCDVLNALLGVGYAEAASMKETVTVEEYATETFELNPSYVADLKEALKRGH